MTALLNRNLTVITVLAGIALGFFLPGIGIQWKPYIAYALMSLMFLTVLLIEPKTIVESARHVKPLAYALFMIFVLGPALALVGKPLFSPIIFAGIMLALSAPSAVSTAFYASIFEGNVAYGLVISIVTNLVAVLTIPITMFLAVGAIVSLDMPSLFLNLIELVLVPTALAFLVKKVSNINLTRFSRFTPRLSLVPMFFIIWGSTASGTKYIQNNPFQFLSLVIFMFAVLATIFGVTYTLGARHERKRAITASIAASERNGALSLVIATALFSFETVPPLVASIVAQSLLLVAMRAVFRGTEVRPLEIKNARARKKIQTRERQLPLPLLSR